MDKQTVISTLAKAVVGKYPCPSGVIAQIIQEVGWSFHTPKDMKTGQESYNLGNIKGKGPAGSVMILTKEIYSAADVAGAEKAGKLVSKRPIGNGKFECKVHDQFKAYHSYTEALADHLAFLHGPRYEEAGVLKAKTPEAFAYALVEAHYATDESYAKSIISIVNSNGLRKYDQPVAPKKEAPKPAAKQTAAKAATPSMYKIKPGDTLSKIAAKYHTTVAHLVALNKIKHPDEINAGDTIKLK